MTEVRGEQQEYLGLDGTMTRILSFSGGDEAVSQTAGFGSEITGFRGEFNKRLHIFKAGGLFCRCNQIFFFFSAVL